MPDRRGYDEDFVLWSFEQARQLRDMGQTGSNLNLDWANVAEEIESLGRSDKRQLESRLDTIYEHLLKLACSPATAPRRGWISTVVRERRAIRRLLHESPSLRPAVDVWVTEESAGVVKMISDDLRLYGEEMAAGAVALLSGDSLAMRVLDDDFIPHPPEPTTSASA